MELSTVRNDAEFVQPVENGQLSELGNCSPFYPVQMKSETNLSCFDSDYETQSPQTAMLANCMSQRIKSELDDPYEYPAKDPYEYTEEQQHCNGVQQNYNSMYNQFNGSYCDNGVGVAGYGHGVPASHTVVPAHHQHPPNMPRKRGRKPKCKLEDGCEQCESYKKGKLDPYKERKKIDRFNGLTEEEVAQRTLPDHLAYELDIIIIGINPGLFAAFKGHHYAGPGNHFWKCMFLSGMTPVPMTSDDDFRLIEFKIGFTNMVDRCTKGSADLNRKEVREGAAHLLKKLQKYRPKIAAFNGKGIYEVYSGKKNFDFGKQPDRIEGTDTIIFVMPSSSARCAQLPRAIDKVPFYVALKKLRDHLTGQLPDLKEEEVTFPDVKLKCEPDDKSISRISEEDIEQEENAYLARQEMNRMQQQHHQVDAKPDLAKIQLTQSATSTAISMPNETHNQSSPKEISPNQPDIKSETEPAGEANPPKLDSTWNNSCTTSADYHESTIKPESSEYAGSRLKPEPLYVDSCYSPIMVPNMDYSQYRPQDYPPYYQTKQYNETYIPPPALPYTSPTLNQLENFVDQIPNAGGYMPANPIRNGSAFHAPYGYGGPGYPVTAQGSYAPYYMNYSQPGLLPNGQFANSQYTDLSRFKCKDENGFDYNGF